jgi:hypothetical protein
MSVQRTMVLAAVERDRMPTSWANWMAAVGTPYCLDASDWRTFRVDRISDPVITRHPSRRREPPAADLHAYVTAQIAAGMRQ